MNTHNTLKAAELPIGAYLGWDWADKKHDLHLRLPGEKTGIHTVIKNTPEVIHDQLQQLHQRQQQHHQAREVIALLQQ